LDYRNFEGYPDPTCYEALSLIELEEKKALRAFRPIIYVCSPYAGDIRGTWRTPGATAGSQSNRDTSPSRRICCFRSSLTTPTLTERELGLFFGNALMSKCAEVWVFGDRISNGMAAEIRRARWKGYRLRYFTEDLKEV
jgi:hypothetical protein